MKRNKPSKDILTGDDFSLVLKSLRLKSGLSQGKVARALGYTSPQFVSNWERGLSEPPIETLVKITELYRVPSDIILDKYIRYRASRLERELRAKLDKPSKSSK
jgi:transcriptional regulator with XRE-family HTH domain